LYMLPERTPDDKPHMTTTQEVYDA
jgi:hypothetical protein